MLQRFYKYLLIFLLLGVFQQSYAQNTASYQDLIKSADSYFLKKDYYNAKTTYQMALKKDPSASYPKNKIDEIIKILNDELDQRIVYEEKIDLAEQAYKELDFEKAIALYKEAAQAIPYEELPGKQITKIEAEWKAAKDKQRNFDELFKKADMAKEKKDYKQAIVLLEQANQLFPDKAEILGKIAQLNILLKQQNAKQNSFNKFIADADKRMKQSRFKLALSSYQQAQRLLPNNAYVLAQITKAKEGVKKMEAYTLAVESGDAHYIALELDAAKKAYEEAQKIWPEKAYPSNMLDKLEEAEQRKAYDLQLLNKNYSDKIALADKNFENQKYENAYELYIKALNLKPEEEYPQTQLKKINKLLAKGFIDVKCQIHDNNNALRGVFIELTEDGKSEKIAVPSNGKYRLKLNLNRFYLLKFEKEGYIHKIFSIDSHLPDDEGLNTVFTSDLSVELFPKCDLDLSFFDQPIAYISYEKASGEFNYDLSRVQQALTQINKLKNQCANKNKEEQKNTRYTHLLSEADSLKKQEEFSSSIQAYQKALSVFPTKDFPKTEIAALNKLIHDRESYTNFVNSGDAQFAEGKLNEALFNYYNAKNLQPKAEYPQKRISEIDGILAAQEAEKQAYQSQLKLADSLFEAKNWKEAIGRYQKLIANKSDNAYAMDRLKKAQAFYDAENKLDADYRAAVNQADSLFKSQSFSAAKALYLKANRLKPDEAYPPYKIEDINTIVEQSDIRKTNTRYQALIVSADQFFNKKAYKNALGLYQQAQNLKPQESYPPQQIGKIEQIMAEANLLDLNYKRQIKSADSSFYLSDLDHAREFYLKAKQIKPQEKYPPAQLAKIDALELSAKNLEQKYLSAIQNGDTHYSQKNYEEAKSAYTLALTYKSAAVYPKNQIKEIDRILAEMNATEAAYQKALLAGDQYFKNQQYQKAIASYTDALQIKENEEYPKTRIATIEAMLASIAKVNARYNRAISLADGLYKKDSLVSALTYYKQAQEIKPLEKYPPDQILRINNRLFEQSSVEEAYTNTLKIADRFFGQKAYPDALSNYQKASQIKPLEKYPKSQINKIKNLLGQSESEYQAFIKQGNAAFRMVNYQDAILAFEAALGIFPDRAYPKIMLDKIDAIIRRESVLALVSTPEKLEDGIEKRYTFKPIDYRDRKNNYILIEMKNSYATKMRVFISFGKDDIKNGGYSVNLVQRDGYTKYFVRIDRQIRWQNEDNNWISLLPQGADLEVNKIQISREKKSE
jgi:hypothetical protein